MEDMKVGDSENQLNISERVADRHILCFYKAEVLAFIVC